MKTIERHLSEASDYLKSARKIINDIIKPKHLNHKEYLDRIDKKKK